ncbi:TPA: penicillin-binding protein 2, partial [Vibrio cholerae]|nr:penicillin-binding protein 2 [Vibrio cholerae]
MLRQHTPIRDHQAETHLFRNRAIVSFVGILICMGLLVTNLYNIQINQYQDYKTRSNDNRIKVVPIAPNRGLIFDRNGVLLAENRPVFNLEVIPEKVPNMEETIARLQQLIEISPEKLAAFEKERKQTRRFNSVPLLTQLTDDEVAKFSVNQHKFPGVSVTANLKRYYPYGEVLTHVIGYVSRINDKDLERLDKEGKKANYQATRDIGKLGIERYYEDLLHGTAGYQEVEVNSRGRVIRTL